MMKLITILANTAFPDQNELEVAQKFLEQAAAESLPSFLVELSKVLANRRSTKEARMAAGLQVKNHLTSKDPDTKKQYQERWMAIDANVRCRIKAFVLQTLGTEPYHPSSAPQCVAAIACAEISANRGAGFIPDLLNNVTDATNTERLKVSTFEAIGYICQDIDPEHLQGKSNQILTAIIEGMRKEEPSNKIKLAATNALINSLEFTKANLVKAAERELIVQAVCEATQCPDIRVQVTALQTLVKIMSVYYEYMETYMGEDLFPITTESIISDIDEVALQGIEFWSTVCDKEMELAVQVYEATEKGQFPEHTSKHFARGALEDLVPILIHTLTRQNENDDDDDWNPCHAASVCLMLLATCCEDDVIPHVQLFLKKYIKHPDWRYRDACIMAFGIILEGPDPILLKPQVIQVMPTLTELMKDPSVVVRDTTAWVAGRICALLPEAAINERHLHPLLQCLIEGLGDEPRVASKVCWAFFCLAVADIKALDSADQEKPSTYCLSSSFEIILQKLLETTDRPDGHHNNLSSEAYDALMMIVMNSPEDCYPAIQKISDKVMESLLRMFYQSSSGGVQEDTLMAISTLCNLCWTLKTNMLPHCDEIVQLLLDILGNENVPWSVKPHILSVFGHIALNIGGEFERYLKIVLDTVQQLSRAQGNRTECDTVGNLNEWREGCLMAYTGIVHGLHPHEMLVQPWVGFILAFTNQIAEDEHHSDAILASAVGLIGDLSRAFGKGVLLVGKCPLLGNLLLEGRRSKTLSTKKLAMWATEEYKKHKNKHKNKA